MPHNRQREKTLDVHAPCCGARMELCYDGTGEYWEPLTELPVRCPKGHLLTYAVRMALQDWSEDRARDGVGDRDERDLCGYDEAQRRA